MILRRMPKLLAGALLLWLSALLAPSAMAQPSFPDLTGRVVDGAEVIPDTVEARLTRKLEALERQSRRQFVIATVSSLQGRDIADYGYQLGRAWGIGDSKRNDGVLLLVAPNERKVRIETGYGLEGELPDALSFFIIDKEVLPRFRARDMPGGIEAGADAIIRQLALPAAEARQIAAEAGASRARRILWGRIGMVIVSAMMVLSVLFFVVLPLVRTVRTVRTRRKRGGGGGGVPITWLGSGGSRSSGSSSSGGSSGGGGFSGGGGSFGGGGATGGW